ncbi:hypothetical protein IZV00_02070 [Sphingobium sp. Cam5-1]|nr:hypothetical protein IZV00_02070 [Sphingobium sp. Cam5-1]
MIPDEPSSPVCYMAEAEDMYMGYIGRDELLDELNALLEAERAGAKVALASSTVLAPRGYIELMLTVRDDEARWCAMLAKQICRLGARPSRKTGAFREKALAISEAYDRLAFLNRGQAWVIRKLEKLLPRVRDGHLHRALKEMLESHKDNVRKAADLLDREHSGH